MITGPLVYIVTFVLGPSIMPPINTPLVARTYSDTAPTINISQDFNSNGRTEIHYRVTATNSLHHANPIVDTGLIYIDIFTTMIVYFGI